MGFLKRSFSKAADDQNFHHFGKYLGKCLDGCLQLDFSVESRKGSQPHQPAFISHTVHVGQPTFGKREKQRQQKEQI